MNILIDLIISVAAVFLIMWGTSLLVFLVWYKWTSQAEYNARLKRATTRYPATDDEWLEWTVRKQARR